jgi:hypothetical protein
MNATRQKEISKRFATAAISGCLVAAVIIGCFAVARSANGQAPVITNPTDLNVVATNEEFDPVSNTWSTKARMPTARWNLYTQAVGGKIYAISGQAGTIDCTPLHTVEVYDPATDSWTSHEPWPSPRVGGAATTTSDGIIYVAGGQSQRTICNSGLVDDTLEAFDPTANGGAGSWTELAPNGGATNYGAASLFDSTLGHEVVYVVGGAGGAPSAGVAMYDPVANTWTNKQPLNQARYGHVVAAVHGKIYAIGGSDGSSAVLSVEEFHPTDNGGLGSWTYKTPMPASHGGYNSQGVGVINGIIYVVGGNAGTNTPHWISRVDAYDPSTDTWFAVPPMLTARDSLGVAVVNNKLYAIGGYRGGFAVVGRPFIYQITATNHPTSYGASGLPPGLSIDSATGIIHGIPTTPTYATNISISASNASGTDYSTLVINVEDAIPDAPAIVSNTSATGRINEPFSFQVLADNSTSAARFAAGGLPPGLNIDQVSGVISGTATSEGNFPVSLSISDVINAVPVTANTTLQLTFISDADVPIITSAQSVALFSNQFFSLTLTADATAAFSYIGSDGTDNGALPQGLSFEGACGEATICGTYAGSGTSPNKSPNQAFVSPNSSGGHIRPDTVTIRRPLIGIIQSVAANVSGVGTKPLNFFSGYSITLNASPSDGGTVDGQYNSDSSFTAIATAKDAYSFVNWTDKNGTAQSTNNSYTFTPTSDQTLTANFVSNVTSYTIAVSASPDAGGLVSGSGAYNSGDNVTVTAAANSCYSFTSWTENGNVVSTSAGYNFTATSDRTLVANFTQNSYNITANAGPGGGASGGAGYSCGATVNLVATPDSCHTFANWTENGSVVTTSATYSFAASSDRTLIANFTQISYSITANAGTGGTASGGGSYGCSNVVTLTATPDSCHTFTNWTENGSVVSTSATYSFAASSNRTLVANFSQNSYTITANAGTGGTANGGASYSCGATVNLTASPDSCHTFANWTENGNVVSTSATYSFPASSDRTLVANFTQISYNITANAGTGGTASGGGSYGCGNTITLTATPDSCHTFANWTENGSVVSTSASYSFAVGSNRTLVANFSQNSYTVTATAGTGGRVSGGGNFACGSQVTLTATPNTGFNFANWTNAAGAVVSTTARYAFTVGGNGTYTAHFVAFPKITISASPTMVKKGGTSTLTVSASTTNPSQPISVKFSTGGNAVKNSDYTLNATQFTIPAGQSKGTITLQVVTKKTTGSEGVSVMLMSGTTYTFGMPSSASVTIQNR